MNLQHNDVVECMQPAHNHEQRYQVGTVLYRIPHSDCYAIDINGQKLVFDSSYIRKVQS